MKVREKPTFNMKGAVNMSNGEKDGTKVEGTPTPGSRYNWILGPGGLRCYRSSSGGQHVVSLWEPEEKSIFHDEVLMKASKEINAILGKVDKDNQDKKRVLSWIEYQNRHLLVWVTYDDFVGRDDDPDTVRKALKLKK